MALDVITERPRNAETPLPALLPLITPIDSFFVRNHFDEPNLDPDSYRLTIGGETERPVELKLEQLERLPHRSVIAVLECAGNGRSHIVPRPGGVPWGDRAVGCARWEGPEVSNVLRSARPKAEVVEAVFRGADHGVEGGRESRFERSLPIDVVREPGPILALRMNGAPLQRPHGAPVRLLVPGSYGMASVKWLTEIEYTSERFAGFFQKEQYVYDDGTPVGMVRLKTLLLRPQPGHTVRPGPVTLKGRSWGGLGGIVEVHVQVDREAWQPCRLSRSAGPWAWRGWSHVVEMVPGRHRVRARARDTTGVWQPLEPVVNRLGYGYNTASAAEIVVGSRRTGRLPQTSA